MKSRKHLTTAKKCIVCTRPLVLLKSLKEYFTTYSRWFGFDKNFLKVSTTAGVLVSLKSFNNFQKLQVVWFGLKV
jgi:hypothetical protein